MDKAIIGKKLGMSQIFTADGKVIPVTVVEAGPCTVVQLKTVETGISRRRASPSRSIFVNCVSQTARATSSGRN